MLLRRGYGNVAPAAAVVVGLSPDDVLASVFVPVVFLSLVLLDCIYVTRNDELRFVFSLSLSLSLYHFVSFSSLSRLITVPRARLAGAYTTLADVGNTLAWFSFSLHNCS